MSASCVHPYVFYIKPLLHEGNREQFINFCPHPWNYFNLNIIPHRPYHAIIKKIKSNFLSLFLVVAIFRSQGRAGRSLSTKNIHQACLCLCHLFCTFFRVVCCWLCHLHGHFCLFLMACLCLFLVLTIPFTRLCRKQFRQGKLLWSWHQIRTTIFLLGWWCHSLLVFSMIIVGLEKRHCVTLLFHFFAALWHVLQTR